MARKVENPPRVSTPRIGELPSLWSKIVGIKCPECGRPQSPRRMGSTHPGRGSNRTDFHMCGGCGTLLYLTGERRVRRFFLLAMPTFFGVGHLGYITLRNVEGLNIYLETKEAYEPNFLGFLLICAAIFFALNLLGRFEIVGISQVSKPEVVQPPLRS